jgi:hypothetical protein
MNLFTHCILRGFQLPLVRIYWNTRVEGETVKLKMTSLDPSLFWTRMSVYLSPTLVDAMC